MFFRTKRDFLWLMGSLNLGTLLLPYPYWLAHKPLSSLSPLTQYICDCNYTQQKAAPQTTHRAGLCRGNIVSREGVIQGITSGHWTLWQIFNWAVTKLQRVVSAITQRCNIFQYFDEDKNWVPTTLLVSGLSLWSSQSFDMIISQTLSLGSWDHLILLRDGARWSDYQGHGAWGMSRWRQRGKGGPGLTPTQVPVLCVITARRPTLSSRHPVQL